MASPQIENGYVRIANELYSELYAIPLTAAEYKVIAFVIRQTYGFNKKEDHISLSQFQQFGNISRQTVVNAINRVVKMNILVKTTRLDGICKSLYSLNKDYLTWVVKTTRLVKSNRLGVVKTNELGVVKTTRPTKDIEHTKDIKPKDRVIRSQIPNEFKLTPEMKSFALSRGLNGNCESVFESFCNYHKAKGSIMKDWNAAWRTWVLNEVKFHPPIGDTWAEEKRKFIEGGL
jgi:phage replication O-like protein O